MFHSSRLPIYLLILISFTHNAQATSTTRPRTSRLSWAGRTFGSAENGIELGKRESNATPSALWLPYDEYSGKSFFDRWDFFDQADPTHGHVTYVNRSDAFSKNLVYVQNDGTVIMKGDNTNFLDRGVFRDSVRISSKAQYNTGLFVLDLNRAPWGCGTIDIKEVQNTMMTVLTGVWPAFWTVGSGNWPQTGEVDIIEGVHDNEHNQVAWHTLDGCRLTTPTNRFTGTLVSVNGQNHTDCNALINDNAGCGIVEWSRASYGPYFDAQGGGVFVMKWDEEGIAVWSFYRAAVPKDIVEGTPDPANWGLPSAELWAQGCDPLKFFANHSIIFDITFCGDWAGNSYATSGCPGTCEDRLIDPANFANASWSINSLKVYRKQIFSGRNAGFSLHMRIPIQHTVAMVGILGLVFSWT
ncbi:glycoside hydrolase family 16 protein [Amanita thiersii Skay4041]|uniref:Glycoside hydrolase family 16 protein n=1 Tax=Amanita thiersii Skay4041 TaxID=703135 RepID=A0A2A9NWG6_9AGAR|nr:glycoside hydrolase family 16 protein [Amanita thiersii Skay4041]